MCASPHASCCAGMLQAEGELDARDAQLLSAQAAMALQAAERSTEAARLRADLQRDQEMLGAREAEVARLRGQLEQATQRVRLYKNNF